MKKIVKGTLLLAAVLIVIVIISKVFSGGSTPPIVGEWTMTHVEVGGASMPVGSGSGSAEFKKNGSCTIAMESSTSEGTWEESDLDQLLGDGFTAELNDEGVWVGAINLKNGSLLYAYIMDDALTVVMDDSNGMLFKRK